MGGRTERLGAALVRAIPFAWLTLFFVAPFILVLKISVSESAVARPPYRPHLEWTLDPAAWRAAASAFSLESYAALFTESLYWRAGATSVAIAGLSTMLLVLAGYPVALAVARAPGRWRAILVGLIILPFWTSFLIRVYAWIAILKPEGLLNGLLMQVGLTSAPLAILGTDLAVLIGIVSAYLPFMVLPIFATLDRMDPLLPEAASDLGATPLAAFWRVTFPLSYPGIAAGVLLCFVPILGEFVIPDLLGGSGTLMLGRVVWSEFFSNRDWPMASAVAVAMLVLVLGPLLLSGRVRARRAEIRP